MKHHNLIDALELSGEIFEQFVRRIPEEQLNRNRGEGFWTVYEHVHHLALVQPLMVKRIQQFKNEERPVIHPFNPTSDESKKSSKIKPVEDYIGSFKSWRAKQVELARSCDESVWEKTGVHPEYDLYTFDILLRHILSHDGWHMYRMEELWIAKDEVLTKM
jgi:hypothetical protein